MPGQQNTSPGKHHFSFFTIPTQRVKKTTCPMLYMSLPLKTQYLGPKAQKKERAAAAVLSTLGGGYLLSHFRSTIGVVRLNFSVRNGKRWDPHAMTTLVSSPLRHGGGVMVKEIIAGNAGRADCVSAAAPSRTGPGRPAL